MEEPRKRPYSEANIRDARGSIGNTPNALGRDLVNYVRDLGLPTLEEFEGKKILDLGSGVGLLFARDLKSSGVNADVVSFSPAFAHEGIRKNAQEILPEDKAGKLMVAGMGEELPFRDATFDIVVCHSVVQWLDSTERYITLLSEVTRVLVQDGRAYIGPMVGRGMVGFADKIPKEELERILNGRAEVSWAQWNNKSDTFRLTLRKT